MIAKIINFTDCTIKWEEVEKIKEFDILKTTNQTLKWHSEGVVWNHTKLVVENMYKLVPYVDDNAIYRIIMILSALFHDIGKGETTFFSNEKMDWTSPNHDIVGAEITRRLLKDENYVLRDSVCYFVKNHMKPLYISDSPSKIRDIITMSYFNNDLEMCNNENLILLKTADCLGSIMLEDDKWQEKLDYATLLCKEHNCLTKPYTFKSDDVRDKYFDDLTKLYPDKA